MDESRRQFLRKTGLLASAAALSSAGKISGPDKEKDAKMIVKKVRPLGFQWETQDPFLFCVHHEDKYPKGNKVLGPDASLEGRQIGQDFILKDGWRMYHGSKVPGFPGHPHRGFETITVVRDGYVDHADSLGGAARYGHGDVQWMTAGKGLQHSEMFPLVHEDKNNRLELFQIWLNLPQKNKMVDPYFKMNWSEDIPVIESTDVNGKKMRVEVLAGKLGTHEAPSANPDSWASDENNHVAIYAIKLEAGAELKLEKTARGVNRTLYFFEGNQLTVEGTEIPHYHAADVDSEVDLNIKNGDTDAQILVLQGKPLNENVVQHGPFVMNSKQEVQQAFYDYQQTRFGGWPWKSQDPTHGSEPRRFAKHPDGTEENRM